MVEGGVKFSYWIATCRGVGLGIYLILQSGLVLILPCLALLSPHVFSWYKSITIVKRNDNGVAASSKQQKIGKFRDSLSDANMTSASHYTLQQQARLLKTALA